MLCYLQLVISSGAFEPLSFWPPLICLGAWYMVISSWVGMELANRMADRMPE